jgi:hypothetical protein
LFSGTLVVPHLPPNLNGGTIDPLRSYLARNVEGRQT